MTDHDPHPSLVSPCPWGGCSLEVVAADEGTHHYAVRAVPEFVRASEVEALVAEIERLNERIADLEESEFDARDYDRVLALFAAMDPHTDQGLVRRYLGVKTNSEVSVMIGVTIFEGQQVIESARELTHDR